MFQMSYEIFKKDESKCLGCYAKKMIKVDVCMKECNVKMFQRKIKIKMKFNAKIRNKNMKN